MLVKYQMQLDAIGKKYLIGGQKFWQKKEWSGLDKKVKIYIMVFEIIGQ